MSGSPPGGYPYGLEAQVAVLASEIKGLHREIGELRVELREMSGRRALDEAEVREIARQVVREETAGDTTARDNVMRLVTFAVSIGTAVFVIRGGR